jgi:hypothetical protein
VTWSAFHVEWLIATTALGMLDLIAQVMSAASWPSSAYVSLFFWLSPAYWTKSPSSNHTIGRVFHTSYDFVAYQAYMSISAWRWSRISCAASVVRFGPFGFSLPSA